MATKCPDAVESLISHLRDTGTGKGKLDKLHKLGCEAVSPESFLERAKELVPPGTMKKINDFINSSPVVAPKVTSGESSTEAEASTDVKTPQAVVVKEQPSLQGSNTDPIEITCEPPSPPGMASSTNPNTPKTSYTSPRTIKGK